MDIQIEILKYLGFIQLQKLLNSIKYIKTYDKQIFKT